MLRYNDYCREYKNGNITIKLDNEAIWGYHGIAGQENG